jgi:O-acetyl-ADP-ribose deacetylase (regulator of RNase III)
MKETVSERMLQNKKLEYMIKYLEPKVCIPSLDTDKFNLFRSLVNIREPKPIDDEFILVQDEFLKSEIKAKGIMDITNMMPILDNLYLWQGDITTIKVDAIVNAANSQMMGCFCPCHGCIDNAIHTYAGVQLRLECADIMKIQGKQEPTGCAKITNAYNLPCRYVLHTVGPIVSGALTLKDCELLESCYRSCLELAVEHNLESVAFCCISTGEFHFPSEKAAAIAINTVREFQKVTNNRLKVIFNVFKDADYSIYKQLLG